jgi:hypothetical protein
MFGLIRLLLALLLTVWGTQVSATDYIVGRAYLEDPSATLTLAEVESSAQKWTTFNRVLTHGYTPSAIWLRLTVDPDVSQPEGPINRLGTDDKLILRIRPAVLDHIELFDPLESSDTPRLTGDHTAAQGDEYGSLNFNFVIPKGNAPRTIWLRLVTSSTSLIYVEALGLAELRKSDRHIELIYSIILALLVLFVAWGMFHWSAHRDKVVGAFVLKQLVGLGFALTTMGYLRFLLSDALPPSVLDKCGSMLVLAYTSAAIWFDLQLLRDYQPPRLGVCTDRATRY